jgi:hypothetical protein
MGQIVMHMVEQLFSRVETARTVDMRIDWRMVVQVFAIINRGMLDLGNRIIDFGDGCLFVDVGPGIGTEFVQVGAGKSQVAQCVQVGRMGSGNLRMSTTATECGGEDKKKRNCDGLDKTHEKTFLSLANGWSMARFGEDTPFV